VSYEDRWIKENDKVDNQVHIEDALAVLVRLSVISVEDMLKWQSGMRFIWVHIDPNEID
jgi:hypothetical protein